VRAHGPTVALREPSDYHDISPAYRPDLYVFGGSAGGEDEVSDVKVGATLVKSNSSRDVFYAKAAFARIVPRFADKVRGTPQVGRPGQSAYDYDTGLGYRAATTKCDYAGALNLGAKVSVLCFNIFGGRSPETCAWFRRKLRMCGNRLSDDDASLSPTARNLGTFVAQRASVAIAKANAAQIRRGIRSLRSGQPNRRHRTHCPRSTAPTTASDASAAAHTAATAASARAAVADAVAAGDAATAAASATVSSTTPATLVTPDTQPIAAWLQCEHTTGHRVLDVSNPTSTGAAYIGRSTSNGSLAPFGNPFVIDPVLPAHLLPHAHREACAQYRWWVMQPARATLRDRIRSECAECDVACHCAGRGLPCHGYTLAAIAASTESDLPCLSPVPPPMPPYLTFRQPTSHPVPATYRRQSPAAQPRLSPPLIWSPPPSASPLPLSTTTAIDGATSTDGTTTATATPAGAGATSVRGSPPRVPALPFAAASTAPPPAPPLSAHAHARSSPRFRHTRSSPLQETPADPIALAAAAACSDTFFQSSVGSTDR
jgi:hypothetical protein